MIKEKWVRVTLLCMLALLVGIGAYALHLRENKKAYQEITDVYTQELHARLLTVKERVLALPDASDAEYWADVPENLHFQSVISEARAVLQVLASVAYQDSVYDIYVPISQFQSAINYFTSDYILYHYVYDQEVLEPRVGRLKDGIRNFE